MRRFSWKTDQGIALKALAITLCAMVVIIVYRQWPAHPIKRPHQAYVWQRHWDPGLQQALIQHSPHFQRLIVLAAEVSWREQRPEITRVPINWAVLKTLQVPLGLAIRVNGFTGDYAPHTHTLAQWAQEILIQARATGLEISEFQWDFDAPSRRLQDYGLWLNAVRSAIAPTPLVVTVLPDWLSQPDFPALVKHNAGFVLQVHGLDSPKNIQDQQHLFN